MMATEETFAFHTRAAMRLRHPEASQSYILFCVTYKEVTQLTKAPSTTGRYTLQMDPG